jgi:hypothetical protein
MSMPARPRSPGASRTKSWVTRDYLRR